METKSKVDALSEASDKSISLSVRSLVGEEMAVVIVTAGSSIRELKERITESLRVPPVMQRLLFGACVLDGSATLSESGVKDGDAITLVMVPLGDAVWSTDGTFFT